MAIDELIGPFEVSPDGAGLRIRMVHRIRGTKDGEELRFDYGLSPKNDLYFESEPNKEISLTGELNQGETEIVHRTRLVRGAGTAKAFAFIDVTITDSKGTPFPRTAKLVF